MNIDESEMKGVDSTAIDPPACEVVSELHGKTIYSDFKMIDEIMPGSFTEAIAEEAFGRMSGTELPKPPMTKGFVKPNEVLNKVKPRLIQHYGPEGSAAASLMSKTIESAVFRLSYFTKRSLKGTDNIGLAQRIQQFVKVYKDGGISCTDFGSFNSSITDKCTEDTSMPGLRKIIEKALMDTFAKLGPYSPDLKNSKKLRWQSKAKVSFDALDLLTWVLIRASGDTLTSVGNCVINWVIDKVVDAIARSIAMMDWRTYAFEDMSIVLPEILSDPATISHIMADVEKEAKWVCDGIRRESYGLPVKAPDCDFICGEGDGKTKGYKWSFIELFETADRTGKRCREVLGYVVGLLYCSAGMSLEPQDRTGRVGYDKLTDATGRIEFVSRIFVEINPSVMYSYPKLRKTFAAASVTFNVEASLHDACAVKMPSLIAVAEQCPLQSEIYAMLYRFHQHRAQSEELHIKRRKYD